MKDNITIITEDDMNGIDRMNGSGSVASKGQVVDVVAPRTLKGALGVYNNSFSQYDELMFIKNVMNDLFDLQLGLFEYKNLPEGLDPYRVELKPFENGSAVWYKVGENIVVANYAQVDYNIYNETTLAKIVEPKSPIINGKAIDVRQDNAHVFRNNWNKIATYQKAYRWIRDMERVLFQMEKNITASAPKGLINLKNKEVSFNEPGETPIKSSLESIVNGQDTFFVLRSVDSEKYDATAENDEQIYIPMELTDRTDTLIRQYTFFKEQLKETLGTDINIHQKKERVVTDEVENQQGIAQKVKSQMLAVRQTDIAEINRKFGTNIIVELSQEEQPEEIVDEEKEGE